MVDRQTGSVHLDGVLTLCVIEGWSSWAADPERVVRALTAPGVTTMVTIENGDVIGFVQMFSDGELLSCLATLVVARDQRRRGIGRELVAAVTRHAGVDRVDLLSEETAVPFYESFAHRRKPGLRIYPLHEDHPEA